MKGDGFLVLPVPVSALLLGFAKHATVDKEKTMLQKSFSTMILAGERTRPSAGRR